MQSNGPYGQTQIIPGSLGLFETDPSGSAVSTPRLAW